MGLWMMVIIRIAETAVGILLALCVIEIAQKTATWIRNRNARKKNKNNSRR